MFQLFSILASNELVSLGAGAVAVGYLSWVRRRFERPPPSSAITLLFSSVLLIT